MPFHRIQRTSRKTAQQWNIPKKVLMHIYVHQHLPVYIGGTDSFDFQIYLIIKRVRYTRNMYWLCLTSQGHEFWNTTSSQFARSWGSLSTRTELWSKREWLSIRAILENLNVHKGLQVYYALFLTHFKALPNSHRRPKRQVRFWEFFRTLKNCNDHNTGTTSRNWNYLCVLHSMQSCHMINSTWSASIQSYKL